MRDFVRPILATTLLVALAGGTGAAARIVARRAPLVSAPTRCGRTRTTGLDYGWPVKPFDVQHPIRGGFGDPRTVSPGLFGVDDAGDAGDYSFHNGVDISAEPGTPVYPVVSGTAHVINGDGVHVDAGNRVFQYEHIKPVVQDRRKVVAGVTVLGTVRNPARHVHLAEIDASRITNPLLHLRPYVDHTSPVVRRITVETPGGRSIDPDSVAGSVIVTAQADDTPPMPVPGAWDGFPVTPALVRWKLVSRSGAVVWSRTAADFRRTEPPKQDFWDVYAAGTFQNFPVFADQFYWRQAGRYIFRLTRRPLDTRRFANGWYTIRVVAADVCGNQYVRTLPIHISNALPTLTAARTRTSRAVKD